MIGNDEPLKEILTIITDGGGDHNVTHAPVQVALICLFFHLNVDMLVAMRTCPTQSWTNVAERVMSILNLALQHCATERDLMDPQYEKIRKSKNNMTQLREAATKNQSLRNAFSNSMKPVKQLLTDRFESMKLKDRNVKCSAAASEEQIKNFFELMQQRIHPSISFEALNNASLSKISEYRCFVEEHCLSTSYLFQIKKCGQDECGFCTPIRLPRAVFDDLHFIPAPLLDSSKEHFQKFESLYGTKPSEKDKPSLKFSLESSDEDKNHKSILVAQKVRAVIPCSSCLKPRCIYSNSKLTVGVKQELLDIIENGDYFCGGSFVPDEDPHRKKFIVRRQVACHMPMEVAYYSAKTVKLTPVCFHCGGVSGAQLSNDADIQALQKQHTLVRPICCFCKDGGKEPATWGTKFVST